MDGFGVEGGPFCLLALGWKTARYLLNCTFPAVPFWDLLCNHGIPVPGLISLSIMFSLITWTFNLPSQATP